MYKCYLFNKIKFKLSHDIKYPISIITIIINIIIIITVGCVAVVVVVVVMLFLLELLFESFINTIIVTYCC